MQACSVVLVTPFSDRRTSGCGNPDTTGVLRPGQPGDADASDTAVGLLGTGVVGGCEFGSSATAGLGVDTGPPDAAVGLPGTGVGGGVVGGCEFGSSVMAGLGPPSPLSAAAALPAPPAAPPGTAGVAEGFVPWRTFSPSFTALYARAMGEVIAKPSTAKVQAIIRRIGAPISSRNRRRRNQSDHDVHTRRVQQRHKRVLLVCARSMSPSFGRPLVEFTN